MSINPQFLPQEAKPLEEWRQDALAAAQYIREHGWCQGVTRIVPTGAVCIIGAIDAATGFEWDGNNSPPERTNRCTSAVAERLGDGHTMSIAQWNDERGRTVGEVIAALEAIATTEV